MKKYLIVFAATVAASATVAPAAQRADRDGKASVFVGGVVDRLGLDLNAVAVPNNVVKLLPAAAATACNMSTSQLAYQFQQIGNMNCKAQMPTKALKKAAKEQAVAKTAATTTTTTVTTTTTTK